LEVIFKTGERFSDLRRRQECLYHPVILGITRPREELYERVDQRIEQMLGEGFIDEVRQLLAKGYSPDLPTMSAIGYREIVQYLQGDTTLEEAISQIKRNTRIFIRRQANWFKPDTPYINWFTASENLVDKMEKTIKNRLKEYDE